jgi:hypothetical protein
MENKKSKLESSLLVETAISGHLDADSEREADALSTKVWA